MSALLQTFLEFAAPAGLFSGAVESCPEAVVLTPLSLRAAGPLPGVVFLMARPLLEAAEPSVELCLEVGPFPGAVEPEAGLCLVAAAQAVPSSEAFESFPGAQLFLEVAALAEFLSEASGTFLQAALFPGAGPFSGAGPLPGVVFLMARPLLEAAEPSVELCLEVGPFPGAVEPEAGLCLVAAAQAVPSSEAFESFPGAQLFLEVAALAEFLSEASGTFLQAALFPGAGPFSGAVFVAVASLVYVAELQVSGNIPALSASSILVSGLPTEFYNPEHSTLLVFPSVDYYASSASSAAVAGDESVYGPIDDHTNYGPCNILSTPGLHHNKNSGHCCNIPIPGRNTGSDTNDLPTDATTIHSKKIGLQKSRGQRKRWGYLGAQLHPVAQQIRGAVDWRYHTKRWEQERIQYQVPVVADLGQVQRAVEWERSLARWVRAQAEVERVRRGAGLGQYQKLLVEDWVPMWWGPDYCIPPKGVKQL